MCSRIARLMPSISGRKLPTTTVSVHASLRLPQALQVTHRLARATRRSCERPKPKEAQADCNQSLDDVVNSEDVVIGDALDDVAEPA